MAFICQHAFLDVRYRAVGGPEGLWLRQPFRPVRPWLAWFNGRQNEERFPGIRDLAVGSQRIWIILVRPAGEPGGIVLVPEGVGIERDDRRFIRKNLLDLLGNVFLLGGVGCLGKLIQESI